MREPELPQIVTVLSDSFKMDSPELGLKLDLKGNNAIQGFFRFECQTGPASVVKPWPLDPLTMPFGMFVRRAGRAIVADA